MKKVIVLLISVFVFAGFLFGDVFITELADPNNEAGARFVELYNNGDSEVDLSTGWQLQRATNGNPDWQTTAENLTGTISAGGFYVVCANQSTFTSTFGFAADQDIGTNGPADSNGDDQIRLLSPGTVVEDMFGVLGEDGSETDHEFENGRAERKSTVTTGDTTYTFAEWNIWNDTGGAETTNDPQDAPADFDPASWIGEPDSPADPEPTNHVTSFTVTVNGYDQIDLTWTENDGTQAPAGYLIKASTSDNITNPTDSTAVSDNSTIGSNSGAKNISHGTISYEWIELDAETDYYFKIYPYTNSGSDIDYKTDGTIPNGNATTGVEPAAPTAEDLYITEVCGDGVDGTNDDDGFMEIYNNSDHAISLRNVKARYYNTNPNDPSQIVVLSGEIASGTFVIITQNETNFNSEYSIIPDFSGSNFYFNGGDDGCDIYYVTTTTILDKFNDNGVSATPWTWNDNYTYERNSINSGADSLNWTEITSGIATPGVTNSTPLSDDVSIKENYTKIADKYELGRTYPNPFNPTFTIPLKLNKNAFVNIQLVNILGQKVLQIENSQMAVGDNDLKVNCESLNSGVYFVKVTIDNVNNIQKVVLLK